MSVCYVLLKHHFATSAVSPCLNVTRNRAFNASRRTWAAHAARQFMQTSATPAATATVPNQRRADTDSCST